MTDEQYSKIIEENENLRTGYYRIIPVVGDRTKWRVRNLVTGLTSNKFELDAARRVLKAAQKPIV